MQSSGYQTNGALAAQLITASTVLSNITATELVLVAGITYRFKALVEIIPANAVMGYKTGVTFSGTNTVFNWMLNVFDPVAGTLKQCKSNTEASSSSLAQTYIISCEGVIRVTVGGILAIQLAQNVSDVGTLSTGYIKSMEAWPVSFA